MRGNLISARDEARIVERHALDSLALAPLLDALLPTAWMDLGAGGGFPGIPLKIVRPAVPLTLVESRRMKSLFLVRATRELGLRGVRVWQRRAEHLASLPERLGDEPDGLALADEPRDPSIALEGPVTRPAFDLITSRAVAPLARLASWLGPLVVSGGHLLAFKGSRVEEEIAAWKAAPGPWTLAEIRRDLRPSTHVVLLRRV